MPKPSQPSGDTAQGLAFALAAYASWGVLPLYMKMLSHVPSAEVVAHRVIWSLPIAAAVLIVLGRTSDLRTALRDPRTMGMALVTAGLITINWGLYVWAIAVGRTLEAALGYYINPLFSVALGALVLGEALTKAQRLAIGLATLAVVILAVTSGVVPWVSLGLTLSWGLYALCKKQLPVGPNQGFMLEVLILFPFAAGLVIWLAWTGDGLFLKETPNTLLLLGCGVVTAVPLMAYANGAKGLRLTTIGILQFIVPTCIFLIAVFVFREPFGTARMIAFPMIWAALVIYSISMVRGMRR